MFRGVSSNLDKFILNIVDVELDLAPDPSILFPSPPDMLLIYIFIYTISEKKKVY